MNHNIYCPFCKEKLVITHQDYYESLVEHTTDNDISLKDGYQCINHECISNKLTLTWVETGEVFPTFPNFPNRKINFEQLDYFIKLYKVNYELYALNSWYYYYNNGCKLIKKITITFKLFNYRFTLYPKKIGGENIKYKYKPNIFKWKLNIRKEKSYE